jgi:ribonuclease-3
MPPPDHKTALQEHLQGLGLAIPSYRTIEAAGPDHRKSFRVRAVVDGRVLGEGEGGTKKAAEQAAARQALAALAAPAGAPEPGASPTRRGGKRR